MAIDALVKPLLSLPIFRGLKPLQLTEIVRHAERVVYAAGDVIITENKISDAAVIIVSGSCSRLDDSDDRSGGGELLPEGSMLAELAMLVEVVNTATVVAQTRVKALRLTREQMLELMQEDPKLVEHFSSQLVGRLQHIVKDLAAVDELLANIAAPHHLPRSTPQFSSGAAPLQAAP